MSEEQEVSYVSVVFKANNPARPRVKKEEETVYDEVKGNTKGALCPQGFQSDKKEGGGRRSCGCVACFLCTLCAALLLVIIGISVHIFTLSREKETLEERQSYLRAVNQNLTLLSSGLNSANENLTRDRDGLASALADSQRQNTELNGTIRRLSGDNAKLAADKQRLATEKENLMEQLQNEPERNISRAQWSVTKHCLSYRGKRCQACQRGWEEYHSSCYEVVYTPQESGWKTWEQARQDCREKMADLVFIKDIYEKREVSRLSVYSSGSYGYWIGLRVNNGVWKWADGSALNKNLWSQEPVAGHCAVSDESNEWTSVRCDSKNRWICEKKGLIV